MRPQLGRADKKWTNSFLQLSLCKGLKHYADSCVIIFFFFPTAHQVLGVLNHGNLGGPYACRAFHTYRHKPPEESASTKMLSSWRIDQKNRAKAERRKNRHSQSPNFCRQLYVTDLSMTLTALEPLILLF